MELTREQIKWLHITEHQNFTINPSFEPFNVWQSKYPDARLFALPANVEGLTHWEFWNNQRRWAAVLDLTDAVEGVDYHIEANSQEAIITNPEKVKVLAVVPIKIIHKEVGYQKYWDRQENSWKRERVTEYETTSSNL